MAMQQDPIGGTDSIFLAYFSGLNFREYHSKIWPKIWYVDVPPSVGSWRSPIEQGARSEWFPEVLFLEDHSTTGS